MLKDVSLLHLTSHLTTMMTEAAFLSCCPDCPSYPANAIPMDYAAWAIWAAIKTYSLKCMEILQLPVSMLTLPTRSVHVHILYFGNFLSHTGDQISYVSYGSFTSVIPSSWRCSAAVHNIILCTISATACQCCIASNFIQTHDNMYQNKPVALLTLKVLNFWKFTSYCSLKPLCSGMGEVVPARTSPTLHPPSPPTVHQLSWLAL